MNQRPAAKEECIFSKDLSTSRDLCWKECLSMTELLLLLEPHKCFLCDVGHFENGHFYRYASFQSRARLKVSSRTQLHFEQKCLSFTGMIKSGCLFRICSMMLIEGVQPRLPRILEFGFEIL